MTRLIRFRCFGGKDVIEIEDLDVSQPDAGEVLVSVRAASVNPVDFKIRSVRYPAVKNDRLPYTPGRDVSGVVEKCGAQATRFKVGDEVFGMVGIHGYECQNRDTSVAVEVRIIRAAGLVMRTSEPKPH
jgi:NADPH:quinone reductase-like Zn-dependent oxidoreductase